MKIPLSWLREYIDLDLSPVEIAKVLTMSGLEVDGIVHHATNSDLEVIFDVSLTPNLGHCSSMIGIARELSAALGKPLRLKAAQPQENMFDPIEKAIQVQIQDFEACPRYACRLIKNVSVKPAPEWLQKKLEACGIRPINNLVDATHHVMLEYGHPLHAFDYDLLARHQIQVRKARDKEQFTPLDGKARTLEQGDLLICDSQKGVALAGIMGGMNSEVSDKTKNVLLEAAYFTPGGVRRTSKRLGLITEASKRFERGTDPNCLIEVLNSAAFLIQQIAGGEVCLGTIDLASTPIAPRKIRCRYSQINHILGTQLSVSEVENIFQRLHFKCTWDGSSHFHVEVPTYRNDLREEIDLVEEVARLYGYDNISSRSTRYRSSTIPNAPIFELEREMRSRLISAGLQEFLTCDLIGPALLNIVHDSVLPARTMIHVLNPTSIEQSILRTSLLPGLLQVVKYNADHQNHEIAGFEIGRIHFKEKELYKEQSLAAIVLAGQPANHWDTKPKPYDFFDLKGILENLFSELRIEEVVFRPSSYPTFHPGRQAALFFGALEIGSMGEVHPDILRRLDFPKPILFVELNLHDLFQTRQAEAKMHALPLYPSSERDLTLTLKEEIPMAQLFALFKVSPSLLLESVTLIDMYRSDKLGKGLKNATLHFVYRDAEKTVSQEAVDAEHARITTELIKSFSVHA